MIKKNSFLYLILCLTFTIGCNKNSYKSGKNISQATGWKINSSEGGFKLSERAPGVSVDEIIKSTEGKLIIEGEIPEMVL